MPDGTRDAQALRRRVPAPVVTRAGPGVDRSRTATRTWATRSSTATDRGCLVDWQVIQFAPWGIDVGYHIASALEPDVRAANERDLLQHYLDALGAAGVTTVPSWDVAWDEYRHGPRPRVLPLGHHACTCVPR